MTAQAAERALNSVEASQPHQDAMEKGAKALSAQRFRPLLHRILVRLRGFNAVQRTLGRLRGHLYMSGLRPLLSWRMPANW